MTPGQQARILEVARLQRDAAQGLVYEAIDQANSIDPDIQGRDTLFALLLGIRDVLGGRFTADALEDIADQGELYVLIAGVENRDSAAALVDWTGCGDLDDVCSACGSRSVEDNNCQACGAFET